MVGLVRVGGRIEVEGMRQEVWVCMMFDLVEMN